MKRIFIIISSIFVLFLLCTGLFISINLSPVTQQELSRNFVINQGEGLNIIGSRLQKNGFIRNKYVFILYSYYIGLNKKLQAGTFNLSASNSTPEIINRLSKGGSHDYWLKIIDGSRAEEIANSIPEQSEIDKNEFIALAKTKEGYLFPDSYLIPNQYSTQQVLDQIESNFNSKIKEAENNAKNTKYNSEQIIILASLIEREAKLIEDKKIISGILINRININMPLQVDATIQYAKDSQRKPTQYWQPISGQDTRQIDSPYNTYKYPGLPPAPICNPGYNSIYAAFNPKETDYLYYISGKDGKMYYAKTLDEHNRNIQLYLQ